jgi:hypothetical protein
MAKVSFSKLGLKKKAETVKVQLTDDIEVEVLQYLPINDKLNLIAAVLNGSADENNFANPVKVAIVANLEIIKAYTNLSFTEKQLEDTAKLYDLLEENDIIDKIIMKIPSMEYEFLLDGIDKTIKAYYDYRNSVFGILDTIGQDYSSLELDVEKLQKGMSDPDNLGFLKDVLTKLG